jgi:hypothetical protein
MLTYKYGGKNGTEHALVESNDRVVVRTKNARPLYDAVYSDEAKELLQNFAVEMEFPDADVSVLKAKQRALESTNLRDAARATLKNEEEIRFAGRVLMDEKSNEPIIYTENLFIKFKDDVSADTCERILAENELTIKQQLDYAINTYFVGAPENIGLEIFELAESLLDKPEVELCHPELIRKRSMKIIHPRQWHLQPTSINGVSITASVQVQNAHTITKGENVTIAVIDDGVDIDHKEFNLPGKVVHSRDVTLNTNDPRPKSQFEKHGTACAGVAAAAGVSASGVAPAAKLLPIRLSSQLGSLAEANAFKWAADHGADVISCSWGPMDGEWWNPDDPAHTTLADLPDSTRLAIDYAVNNGRNGKGCVVLFAAGNGNEDVKYDGYASYEKVIAVAACNDTNKRSVYSDYGKSVWCSFPSSDFEYVEFNHPAPLTTGIYTTDRRGAQGYGATDYTASFGGTSSSCPGAAGIAALILSVNPSLTWQQVRNVIKDSCEKIDLQGGSYDNTGRSNNYGYGKPDAAKAVNIAIDILQSQMKKVRIFSAMVNPKGKDAGKEKVSLFNMTDDQDIDLTGWSLKVKTKKQQLTGILPKGEALPITLDPKIKLSNRGGTLVLLNPQGEHVHEVTYKAKDVKEGAELTFAS